MIVRLAAAAVMLAAASLSSAAAQMTYPLKELEASRRERIIMDQRMQRDGDEQRRKDKARAAGHLREDAAKAARPGPRP
jgi:hypothetical protein